MSYCAIFDLDETIIKSKSMESILRYYYKICYSDLEYAHIGFSKHKSKLEEYAKNNGREQLNIYYYKLLKGVSSIKIKQAGTVWFDENKDNLFNESVLNEINMHRSNDATIIIITGSFKDCLEPVLDYLSIEHIICTELEQCEAMYTGNLCGIPVIGNGKALLLTKYLQDHKLSLVNSYAYCDDISDLPVLLMVEHPVVIGNNDLLTKHANEKKWQIIL